MKAWIKTWIEPTLAKLRVSRQQAQLVIVVRHHDEEEAIEVRAVDKHGNIVKSIRIQQPIDGPLSMHGDLICASHGWGMTSVVDMVTGAIADVGVNHRKKVNKATPYCVLGHVPATREDKVLRIQADCLSRRRRQMCEVVTLGGAGEAGRWRRRTPPPATLSVKPGSSSWNVAVVAGLAYFLVCWGWEDELNMDADDIAVFDLATEEWKPATLQGPMSSSLLAGTDEDVHIKPYNRRRHPPFDRWYSLESLRKRFQLARLGDSLVVVYCNVEETSTELWFLEDMDDETAPRWSRRYTLECTPFELDKASSYKYFMTSATVQQYHCPLAVLDDGRILVWVDKTSALKAYDPVTSTWTDLATLTGCSIVGMHHR